MNRLKITIRNIIIIIALLLIFLNRYGLYFTPIAAHESSERSIHYGPSKVVHIEDFEKGKYILGKYDKWVSCNTVNKFLFFWSFGNQVTGFEIDKTNPLNYSWGTSKQYYHKFYGIINDNTIKKVEAALSNGEVIETATFYDDLFLITWKSTEEGNYIKSVKGYDETNNIIFEESR